MGLRLFMLTQIKNSQTTSENNRDSLIGTESSSNVYIGPLFCFQCGRRFQLRQKNGQARAQCFPTF